MSRESVETIRVQVSRYAKALSRRSGKRGDSKGPVDASLLSYTLVPGLPPKQFTVMDYASSILALGTL